MRQNRSFPHLVLAVLAGMGLFTLVAAAFAAEPAGPVPDRTGRAASFIENAGQFAPEARFRARGAGGEVWLADDAIWITVYDSGHDRRRRDPLARPAPPSLSGAHIRLSFDGGQISRPVGVDAAGAVVSYFHGNDPAGWRAAVPVWESVRYPGLYPGVDLELSAVGGQLRSRLICSGDCGALNGVRLRVEGASGLATDGRSLQIETAAGPLRLSLPVAVDARGQVRPLDAAALVPDAVGVPQLESDAGAPGADGLAGADGPAGASAAGEWLEFIHAGYLGGSSGDTVRGVAADAAGNTYITGDTVSPDFPTTPGAFVDAGGETDVYITKIAPDGNALVFSAVVGGEDFDTAAALAVGPGEAVYVGGYTDSGDLPLTGDAFDSQCDNDGCPGRDGGGDGFIIRLRPEGDELTYGSYFGGQGFDMVTALAVAVTGGVTRVSAAGDTDSADLPVTAEAFDTTLNDRDDLFPGDGFAARLNLATGALEYSTYLGGIFQDNVRDLALGLGGATFVTGATMSGNFPTTPGAVQPRHASGEACALSDYLGCFDGFVVRLNNNGSALEYGTFLGGEDQFDSGNAVAVNAQSTAFVTGETSSDDFPITPGAFDISHGSGGQDTCDDYACPDAFVASLNGTGSRLNYGTFLGGSGENAIDWAEDIVVNAAGNFPVTPGAWDRSCGGCIGGDGFLTRVSPDGRRLRYSTYLGGSDFDILTDIAAVSGSDWIVAGYTYSADFPTAAGVRDNTLGGGVDGVVARIQIAPLPANAGWLPLGSATGGGISGTPGESAAAALTDAPDGSLFLAWSENGAGDSEIFVKRWNGSNWAPVGPASASAGGISNNNGDSAAPDILATPDGVLVAWSDTSSGDAEVYVRRWDGSTWAELAGSASGGGVSNNSGESLYPSLALGPNGPVVAWSDDSSGNAEVYARRWDGKAWQEMGRGSATGGGISKNDSQSFRPSAAAAANGEVFVAWTDDGGDGDTDIYVKRFNGKRWVVAGSGSASGGGISQDAGLSRGVALAGGEDGRVVAAWTDDAGGVLAIYARQWDGAGWTEIGRGSASGRGISLDAGSAQGPSVALNSDSQPLVAWYDASSGNAEIYVRRWNGARWQEVRVGAARGGGVSDNAGASSSPSLALLGGTPIVAWADNTGGNYEMYVRRAGELAVTCRRLQLTHTGNGADPTVVPAQSPGCEPGRFIAGAVLALSAAPAGGNTVVGWSGTDNDASTALTNTLTMPAADHVVAVIYGPAQGVCYPLTLSHTGKGADPDAKPVKSTGCPTLSYTAGTAVTLTAAPAAGHEVAEWYGTDNDTATTVTNSLTMPAQAHTVSVVYEPVAVTCYRLPLQYTGKGNFPLALPANSPGCAAGRYTEGELVELLARPANGWRLWRWTGTNDDGSSAGLNKVTIRPFMEDVVASYRPSFSNDFSSWMPWAGGQ
jgi:hypothetical protein